MRLVDIADGLVILDADDAILDVVDAAKDAPDNGPGKKRDDRGQDKPDAGIRDIDIVVEVLGSCPALECFLAEDLSHF